jgi:hypothetical protein
VTTGPDQAEETTFKGVPWRRRTDGSVYFHDQSTGRWVKWGPRVDAPPLPPRWGMLGVATKVTRPGWRSPWRLVPIVVIVFAIVYAVVQVERPSTDQSAAETRASAALLGKCLAQDGTAEGHPKYSTTTVPCTDPKAAVKVVAVVPSTPGSPPCPAGTTGMEIPFMGVAYPHVECIQPLPTRG